MRFTDVLCAFMELVMSSDVFYPQRMNAIVDSLQRW